MRLARSTGEFVVRRAQLVDFAGRLGQLRLELGDAVTTVCARSLAAASASL